jgi:hypothetical protein
MISCFVYSTIKLYLEISKIFSNLFNFNITISRAEYDLLEYFSFELNHTFKNTSCTEFK